MKNSPVRVDIIELITINRNSTVPIYLQIVNQIVQNIEEGNFYIGLKIPGTRTLAHGLNIHRKTVIAAYDELENLGWIEQKPNIGCFVLPFHKSKNLTIVSDHLQNNVVFEKVGFNYYSSFLMQPNSKIEQLQGIHINEGFPDERLVEVKEFFDGYHQVMKRKLGKWKEDFVAYSQQYFESNFKNYLTITKNLDLPPDSIITTRTIERALHSTIEFLIENEDVVVVGNLSYYKANMLFLRAGAKIKTIAIDENGLNVNELEKLLQRVKIRCVYINPNAHYPTTVKLSEDRKIKLIELAKQYHFAIIEDHSQNEIQFNFTPKPSLFNNLTFGNIIHIGGIGSALLGHLQTGYVVAHPEIIKEINKYVQLLDPQGDKVLQQTLGELIEGGNLYRFHKKVVGVYRLRRDFVVNWVEMNANLHWKIVLPSHGLAVWIEFKNHLLIEEWRQFCISEGVLIPRELIFQNHQLTGLRFGFGSLNLNELSHVLEKMLLATQHLNKKNRHLELDGD